MRLAELNWMEIETYLKKDDRLLLVLGATEQHGYISIGADVKIPLSLADAASQQSGVLVAPPLNFGCSSYFTKYPGTISLRVKTLVDVVEDMVRSLFHQGFKRLVIVNGHGGNKPAKVALGELANELHGLKMSWYDWWEAPSVNAISKQYNLQGYHASWIEAFPFVRQANMPAGEKPAFETNRILSSDEVRQAIGDGVYGGAYHVDEAIMSEIFAASLRDVLFLLQFSD
jgi:creatinine amidohydrolase